MVVYVIERRGLFEWKFAAEFLGRCFTSADDAYAALRDSKSIDPAADYRAACYTRTPEYDD